MYIRAHIISSWLHFAISFAVGYSAQMTEQDSIFVRDAVFKNLPTATCDMIVVSSTPFPGDILLMPVVHVQ